MRIRLGAALASVLTISIGVIVGLGLLLPDDLVYTELVDVTQGFANVMVQLVTITIALTVLVGVLNLLSVHLGRMRHVIRRRDAAGNQTARISGLYSLALLVSFAVVIGSTATDRDTSLIILETVQFSVEAALAGLILFALVFGAYRMMRHNVTWSGSLFILALLVVLLGALPLDSVDALQDIRDWMLEIPVSAGARGLLMGIALATLVTGVRVLVGTDRSYRE